MIPAISGRADVLELDDKNAWINAIAGDFATIDFTELAPGTHVTD